MSGQAPRDLGDIDSPTIAEMMAARDASLATLTPPISAYGSIPVAAPITPAPPMQQSTDPNAPYYVNPASPYYKNPNARVIPLGNSTPAAPPPPAPVDPNRYAQQSTDPNAPYYVNPASPYYNPKAPKPVATASGVYVRAPADAAKPLIGPVDTPAPTGLGNKYASGGSSAAPSAGINWGGAGGTATIAAHEQPVVSAARQKEVLGAIEGQKAAAGESADAAANIETAKGQGSQDIAKAYEDAGVDAKLRHQEAADQLKAYRAQIDDFSAKVAKDKINPNRMWEDAGTGQKIAWTAAKALGAVGQAFLHTSTNQVADSIDAMVAQDVAAQRANHEIGRERLADMNTFYGHALRESANAEEAERLATGYALDAAKQQAQSLTLNANSAAQKAKGKELTAALDEKIAEKGIVMNPLVQARTVATGVDMNKVYADAREYAADQAKLGNVVKPDEAIRYAYKLRTGRDPLTGAGAFNQGAKAEPGGKQETQVATDEFNKQLDDLTNHPVITGSGLGTAVGAHLPQRLAPESNDAQQQLHAINTRMLQAIGKVAKDADGKPNKSMIEKIEQRFEIHLSDSPAIKQQKLQGIRDVYNSLALEQGAKAPQPTAGTPPSFKP